MLELFVFFRVLNFFIINLFFRLRVNKVEEDMGLNISEHNASTATHELLQVLNKQQETDDFSLRAPQDPFTEAGVIASQYNNIMDKLEQSENQKIFGKTEFLKKLNLQLMFKKDSCQEDLLIISQLRELIFQLEKYQRFL